MIVKIFTGPDNYKIDSLYNKDEDEYLIGVDYGAYKAINSKLELNLAIGDFDSVSIEEFDKIKHNSKKIKILNKDKDYTDTYEAVKEALKTNFEKIIIYGGLGKRVDHLLSNLNLLSLGNIEIKDEYTLMYMVDPGEYEISYVYEYVSFFAHEKIENLTIKGFEYELQNYQLNSEDSRCVSNSGSGTISFDTGVLLIVLSNEHI